jgi:hypothetical protein
MKKQYFWLNGLAIFAVTVLLVGPKAYADDDLQFSKSIQGVDIHRAQIESQLSIDPNLDTYPHATSYYDDLEDHYEQDQLMRDVIDQGIT